MLEIGPAAAFQGAGGGLHWHSGGCGSDARDLLPVGLLPEHVPEMPSALKSSPWLLSTLQVMGSAAMLQAHWGPLVPSRGGPIVRGGMEKECGTPMSHQLRRRAQAQAD
ncbi:hypothetical protein NDU88_003977 [Pleurodeles waltl]|uniref:Uncharacterized protein n=1 Tax=Pleurodeles waltl TaxID=8319 RepID=A0AAV7SHK6_PLEWA|nr:hypothetical protein NDU88_003977 [Pleurodeles waltl]